MLGVKAPGTATAGTVRSSAQRVLTYLLTQHRPVTRSEIASACELSRPTVFAAIDALAGLGLVVEVGQRSGLPGRSATLYEVATRAGLVAGLDIGGSNLRVAVSDARGRLLVETREATAAPGGEQVVRQAVKLFRKLRRKLPGSAEAVRLVGVSVPGVVDPDSATVHYAWNIGQPDAYDFRGRVASALRIPVLVDNNVNLAAIGEQWQGAAQQLRTFAVIAVGAGIGAGVVYGGQLLRGAHGAAGEVAFLPLPVDYRRLRAAGHDEAGGLVLLQKAQARSGWPGGRPPQSVEELFSRAVRGDPPARELVEQESQHIAAVAASICAVLDPEAIVLTGGIGANPALVARVGELLAGLAPFPPAVIQSSLGEQASLIGALAMAVRSQQELLVRAAGQGSGG